MSESRAEMHKLETKRFQSLQLHTTDHEVLLPAWKKKNFTVADGTHEMNMAKLKNGLAQPAIQT